MLQFPESLNKNALDVRAMGSQAETGALLIQYMCQRLGVGDLQTIDVLDFGCGCRFADAIVNKNLPVKSYTGIDVDTTMIDWLGANVQDSRLRFHHWDAKNPMYNPNGFPLTAEAQLPTGNQTFDVICMFSVITHQLPDDAESLFRILRRSVRPEGKMFFSVNLQDMEEDYKEMVPGLATAFSAYSFRCLSRIIEQSGWRVISLEAKSPRGVPIQDSLLCAPA